MSVASSSSSSSSFPHHPAAATPSFYDLLDATTGIRPRRSTSPPLLSYHYGDRLSTNTFTSNLDIALDRPDVVRPQTRRAHNRFKVILPPVATKSTTTTRQQRGRRKLVEEEEAEGKFSPDPQVNVWEKESIEWSPDVASLTKLPRNTQTHPRIAAHIKTLLLHDRKIEEVDPEFRAFVQLETLSLTGNHISSNGFANVPPSVKVLTVNANMLAEPPWIPHLTNLMHIGLTHNTIRSLALCESAMNAPGLISFDASWNHIDDLEQTVNIMTRWKKLRSLVLLGNPVFLIPNYRKYVIYKLPSLSSLDDIPITARTSTVKLEPRATLKFRLTTLLNPPLPMVKPAGPDPNAAAIAASPTPQPADVHAFQVRLALPGYWETTTPSLLAAAPPPAEDANFDEKGAARKKKKEKEKEEVVPVDTVRKLDIAFDVLLQRNADWPLAKALKDGLTLTLVQTRQSYVPITPAEPPADTGRPASSKSNASRRPSNVPPAKGGGKKELKQSTTGKTSVGEDTALWSLGPLETCNVGVVHIPLTTLLEGSTVIEGDYILERPDHPTPPVFSGTLSASVHLNPPPETLPKPAH
ncbi:hypothetical protein DFJ77DRAFT_505591 [Powellomyces hirtus]|nr:hypothetical protein DFJ77DRAFT_505591 [Powellomyces hirtus]